MRSAQSEPARRADSPTLNQSGGICVDYSRHLANTIKPKCVAKRSV